ncbi:nuclear transport factor 2 family protein [Croceiramulus getboli]|nr:nuclear transport factor 2 family protein [Flavobacteriaceae bacterium YJPT1-3]
MRKHLILIAIALCLTAPATAQESTQKLDYRTGNPADWPEELDAVNGAPDNHKILLENDQVRVLDVTLAPNEVENLHHHRWPSVLYIMQAGEFTDQDAEGNFIMDSRELPEPLQFPLTMWKKPEAPHTVTNLSDTKSIHLVRVELKQNEGYSGASNLKIVNSVYESFGKGDIPAALAVMDKDVVWNEAESNSLAVGNPYIGPDAVLKGVFMKLGEMYQSFSLKDIKLHEMSDNQVLATLRYAITSKKGMDYEVQAAHHWTLKEGKIVQFQQYADTKKLADTEAN